MSHYIIDRRPSGSGKSAPNRKKLIDRVRGSVKQTVKDAIANGNIADVVKGGNRVRVPAGDLSEPQIVHGDGGVTRRTIPGNDRYRFNPGDTTPRPPSGNSGQPGDKKAGDGGDGADEFTFELTRDEFLEFFFEDLELPDLTKKQLAVTNDKKPVRNGFSRDGNPAALDLLTTMKSSMGRRAALRTPKKKRLRKLEAEFAALTASLEDEVDEIRICEIRQQLDDLNDVMAELRRKIKTVPYVDEIDLRYRTWTMKDQPATQAAMICVMDVSGSMTSWHKDIAKRFYMLLYLFLYKNYEKVDIVFVRHHHTAEEVDEQAFFYDRSTGGTIVSQGLALVNKIIDERYSSHLWNTYVAQASDGDNWHDDHDKTIEELNKIMSKVQYFFYIDIARYGDSDMWNLYEERVTANNFAAEQITDAKDIYGVFRKLFEARA